MKTIYSVPVLCLCLLLTAACGAGTGTAKSEPTLTVTLPPTRVVVPTASPKPSPTSTPTAIPQALGIDTPVSLDGSTFLFQSATVFDVTNGLLPIWGCMDSTPNHTFLRVKGKFTGDPHPLFENKGAFHPEADNGTSGLLYIAGEGGKPCDWYLEKDGAVTVQNQWFDMAGPDEIQIIFGIKGVSEPFVLHNTVKTTWTVDLSPIFTK